MSMGAFCTHVVFIFYEYTIGKVRVHEPEGIEFKSCTLTMHFFTIHASIYTVRAGFFPNAALPVPMGRTRGRPPAKKKQPTILEAGLYPAIANPMSLIGRHINVPGSYWPSQGQNRTELATLYQCVVIDYTSVHMFVGGKSSRR